jgi:hypothetical protein
MLKMQLQVRDLLGSQLEEKVRWKSTVVATDLLIQSGRSNSVEGRQLTVEQHPTAAQEKYLAADFGNRIGARRHEPRVPRQSSFP